MLLRTAAGLIIAGIAAFAFGTIMPWDARHESGVVRVQADDKVPAGQRKVATFASGCYWCTESDFDKLDGVLETISGFMGGHVENPTYRQVTAGGTGHLEVVQLTYDSTKVSYQQLLDHYWINVDPLDGGGQFCDRGDSYRPAIFVHDDNQRQLAEASKKKIANRFDKPIAVKILDASTFTAAADYHQNYYKKNSLRYKYYRFGCGRDRRLQELWGDKRKSS